MEEIGFVKSTKNYLVTLDGLPSVRVNDLIVSETGEQAFVFGLSASRVEALMLTDGDVLVGQSFKPVGKPLSLDVGDFLLGRSINPLGEPLDGKGALKKSGGERREIERVAPGISARQFINRQLTTGITVVDTILPLGKGQRELVLGDARSGKTGFLLDLITNQKTTGVVCVYAWIGRPLISAKSMLENLEQTGAMDYFVMVGSFSADPAPLIYLTPKAALTVAEYFQSKGKDVLVIMDDMGNHAKIYREIALLSARFPGREAYPGDIFYQQASLVERAGNFSGSGSITALPVIELSLDDFASFIPTNLMGMTDGHLLFRSSLRNQGRRPAIDVPISVTRVGQQTQTRLHNAVAGRLKQTLARAAELSSVAGFGGELPASTQLLLKQQEMIVELLTQEGGSFINPEEQAILMTLPFSKLFADKDGNFVALVKKTLVEGIKSDEQVKKLIQESKDLGSFEELVVKIDALGPKFKEWIDKVVPPTVEAEVVDKETWLPKV